MNRCYPSNIEAKLGFDSIRTRLKELCESGMGAEEVERMRFSANVRMVSRLLRQTDEMKGVLETGSDRPDVSFNRLQEWLVSLKTPGSHASVENMCALRMSLLSFKNVREFYCKRMENSSSEKGDEKGGENYRYSQLGTLFSAIQDFPEILGDIDRIIDKTGLVKDSASPELAEIRRELSGMNSSIARAVQRIYAQAVKEGYADKETGPTVRDGRMVIPVSAPNKRNLPGIIYDESSTGKTVFIQPAETVALSNRMRELELEEQREIARLMMMLADAVRPYIEDILYSNDLLGKLDFITAKARFAIEVDGMMPSISGRPELEWYGAQHPVLLLTLRKQGKTVVPLNLNLEKNSRFLVISGPNAGGKSVALKTVGIVQYMLQCGLLPTLYSNSHAGIFEKIFVDIGDEQSIENDLSTYSSHLRNMRYFLLHTDNRTLVLIDEIGSGTEPNIGAALAQSILQQMAKSGCYGIVTTHYHNLKKFAEETAGFINGAMLYDRQKLQPTFQLSVGNAGSSFAIEIAGKIGLPREVIDNAKELVGTDYVESDKYLMEIARDRKYWQSKRLSVKEQEAKVEALAERYEKLISDLNKQRNSILRDAKQEASEILAGANKKIENTIAQIKAIDAEKEKTKSIRKELSEFKEKIAEEEIAPVKTPKAPKSHLKKKNKKGQTPLQTQSVTEPAKPALSLEPGSYVKMAGSNTVGRILSISGKTAEVAFGQLRTSVKLDKLTPTAKPKENLASGFTMLGGGVSDSSRERRLNFKDELDIRGMRADEALDRTIHFIDDALEFGIRKVRILHGTGAGILRQLVRQQLDATPGITGYADEDVRLGGAGITVVTL